MSSNLEPIVVLKDGQTIRIKLEDLTIFRKNFYTIKINGKTILLSHEKDGKFIETSILS